jgi:hypothetical protein
MRTEKYNPEQIRGNFGENVFRPQENGLFRLIPFVLAMFLMAISPSVAQEAGRDGKNSNAGAREPVLWVDPGDIRSRNLFWGPGGEERQPKLPVQFQQEDMHGTSPKFEVRDADGKKWTAKMGLEPRPETAAARLLWAVGYVATENYYYAQLNVGNMPTPLRRGQNFVQPAGNVSNVRLQRHPPGYKRAGNWNWRNNPFYGTREFNGLRVMMGLIGNWDLKDDNNAVLESEKDRAPVLYEVSDVGTSMGTPGKSYSDRVSKGNLAAYKRSKLIAHKHKNSVDLNFPKRPPLVEFIPEFEWGFFFHQLSIRWIGKNIPRQDAKWIGSLLAQLSPDQIRDAFRAAGYAPQEIDAYTQAVISRIQELNGL